VEHHGRPVGDGGGGSARSSRSWYSVSSSSRNARRVHCGRGGGDVALLPASPPPKGRPRSGGGVGVGGKVGTFISCLLASFVYLSHTHTLHVILQLKPQLMTAITFHVTNLTRPGSATPRRRRGRVSDEWRRAGPRCCFRRLPRWRGWLLAAAAVAAWWGGTRVESS
jgi:hypothetical protein